MSFFIILLLLIIIAGLLSIIYMNIYNKLQKTIIRIQDSEAIIDSTLRKKFDLMIDIVNLIKDKIDENPKILKEIENFKVTNITNFDFDRKVTKYILLLEQIKNDYPKLHDNQKLKQKFLEIKNIDETLEASKAFYNKYTTSLNEMIKSFPSNVVAKLHKISVKNYFDGKDMNDDILDDFKL